MAGASNNGKPSWLRVGEILKSKSDNLYIKIKEDVTLTAGQQLMIQDPRERLQKAGAAGRMTEEQVEERISKIPDFVRYEVVLPPKNQE